MNDQELDIYLKNYYKSIKPHYGVIIIELTEKEKKERDEYIKLHNLPF